MNKPIYAAFLALLCLFTGIAGSLAYAEDSREIVLQTIAMEAANQSDRGQYLVASVIVNRAMASGQTLGQVCTARKQFSAWNDPKLAARWLSRHYDPSVRLRAYNALQRALNRPYEGIRHYHTNDVRPYWSEGHKAAITEGAHLFYEGIA